MDQDYNNYGYGSDDFSRYGRSRRRRSLDNAPVQEVGSAGVRSQPHRSDNYTRTDSVLQEKKPSTSARTGDRRSSIASRGYDRSTDVTQRQATDVRYREQEKKNRFLFKVTRPQGFENLYSKFGSVELSGKVIECKQKQRRTDFFHVMWDTLVNGSRLSFSPVGQVITVELNDTDHTRIDTSGRRTVVVKIAGKIYDGSISVNDYVAVSGHWSRNNTINASKILNQTNGSRLAVSHALPAAAARIMALVLLFGIMSLIFNFPLQALTNALSNVMGGFLNYAIWIIVGVFFLSLVLPGIRRSSGRLGRWLSSLAGAAVAIALVIILAYCFPNIVYYLLIIGLSIYGIWMMIKAGSK